MSALDTRINAVRPDLADARLRGRVAAPHFADGLQRRVRAPATPLRRVPASDGAIDSEAICGELLRVFEEREGWAWAQCEIDSYVGYVAIDALGPVDPVPTHRINALRAFVFPGPDLKLPPIAALPFAADVTLGEEVVTRGTLYRLLAGGGAIAANQVAPLTAPPAADFVAVAELFLHVPYLWGGRTSLGFDCSGLLQTALKAAGIAAPRDTDMQEQSLGRALPGDAATPLRRGDLVFWKGHVGMMVDADRVLHANAHHMAVAIERLADAIARIAAAGNAVTGIRRLA